MKLSKLQITNLRTISSANFDLHPHLNFIVGSNGTGKTSFLEAIHLLGTGYSFRTRESVPLISHGSDYLTVFARTFDEQSLSIQKSLTTATQVRLNGFPCKTSSELAYFLPCQVFYQDIFHIIDAGPSVRRSLLDWGLFHVEQSYFHLLKEYQRVLKQRNALLRLKAKESEFTSWNLLLATQAEQLDIYRLKYIEQLNLEFKKIIPQLSDFECDLLYYKGWDKKENCKSLLTILSDNYQSDMQRQYTQHGPHQADIAIKSNEFKIKQYFSRGQQKIFLFALKLAQTNLLNKDCIFICDDIISELDTKHVDRLFDVIASIEGQFLITLLNTEMIPARYKSKDFSLFTLS